MSAKAFSNFSTSNQNSVFAYNVVLHWNCLDLD